MPTPTNNSNNQEPGHILHNLMLFGEVLRRLGLDFGSGNMLDLVRATEDVPIGRKQDFRYAARCLLVHRKQDLSLFDEAFQVFWRRPATGQSPLDLRSMGEERRYRTPQIIPPSVSDSGDERGQEDSQEVQPAVDLSRTYSAREVLREKDFADFTQAETAQAKVMMAELSWDLGRRRTRRLIPGEGAALDLRRTFRRNLKYGGELLELARRQPKDKPRSLVLLCDVSGSMERYTRMLLHFIHTVAGGWRQVEAFLFATRLTRITRFLDYRSVDQAVSEVARVVPDWAGGTRTGEALKTFNFRWSRRVMRNGAVVLVISDGWDRGEPELLAREMARLRRSCHRLIWLNPLLGSPDYQPLTQGMQAALPHIDDFLPVHNLNSLEALARRLNQLGSRSQITRPPLYKGMLGKISDNRPELEAPTPPQRQDINPALASTFTHPLWQRSSRSNDQGQKQRTND
jgi:uncharacterized protein with von Willebrand factor type A (vWA) domain